MPIASRALRLSICSLSVVCASTGPAGAADRVGTEIARIAAPEAVQGAAVDERHVYAIANKAVGQYDRESGELVRRWESDRDHPLVHLNAGVIHEGRLYCAHSNFPATPTTSSIEIWDAETLEHVDSYSLGVTEGSLTWIDHYDGHWWAVFAHYSLRPESPTDNRWTTLVRLDDEWRRQQAWVFPAAVVERFGSYSNSGGTWGPDGRLYCTGHDRREIYVLQLPKTGSVLRHVETIKVPVAGQGITWDRSQEGTMVGIDRGKREVVLFRIEE